MLKNLVIKSTFFLDDHLYLKVFSEAKVSVFGDQLYLKRFSEQKYLCLVVKKKIVTLSFFFFIKLNEYTNIKMLPMFNLWLMRVKMIY
jgi:hypothetical protein